LGDARIVSRVDVSNDGDRDGVLVFVVGVRGVKICCEGTAVSLKFMGSA